MHSYRSYVKDIKPIVTEIYIHNSVNKFLIDLLQVMNFIVNSFVNEAFYLFFLFIFFLPVDFLDLR